MLQPPQFSGSCRVLVQPPAHTTRPPVHDCAMMHCALEHTVPDGQRLPHAPQLAPLELRSTQVSPHRLCPCGQSHVPAMHCVFEPHVIPHVMQLPGSVAGSTHTPPQSS